MSQLTTHILDTSRGQPAEKVTVVCYYSSNDAWTEQARGITNADGRLPTLFGKEEILKPGLYKLRFYTKEYFDRQQVKTFYPFVEIVFELNDTAHYHVPLLLNPYGYSTYRGS